MNYKGEETAPLDLSGLPAILDDFRAEGVEAIAICLLHAYANPAHEQALAAEVRRLMAGGRGRRFAPDHPRMARVRAHQHDGALRLRAADRRTLSRPARARPQGQRLSRPALHHAIELRRRLARRDQGHSDHHGRVGTGLRLLGRRRARPPHRRAERSGARHRRHDRQMLADRGRPGEDQDRLLDRARAGARPAIPIMVPVVDLVEIGNGGGSIAWVDDFGKLHVGPQSAGAVPGPAAYGRGGDEATTTDANLWLGRINRDYFCGGEIKADMQAVESRARARRREARRQHRSRRRAASSASPTTTWSMR